jgi:hypothetical protein
MNARQQHRIPERSGKKQVDREAVHATFAEHVHEAKDAGRRPERERVDAGRIGNRDDRDRPHVVHDRHGEQEQLEAGRCALSQQGQHADRKGDVRGRRDGPAAAQRRIAAGKEQVDRCRQDHACGGGNERQSPLRPGAQPPVDELALDLQPDEQEEQSHQPIVDPQMNAHRTKFRRQHRPLRVMQQVMVGFGQRTVGHNQRGKRGRDQKNTARGFVFKQAAER